jgi:Transposase
MNAHVVGVIGRLQNFRENIERDVTFVSRSPGRSRLWAVVGDRHDTVRRGRRTIAKWVKLDVLPDRRRSLLKPSSPLYFQEFLARRWAEGDRVGRRLFHDVRRRGYLGALSHLERLISTWRRRDSASVGAPTQPSPPLKTEPVGEARAVDPATEWQISPTVAASLCMKPSPTLTPSGAAKVVALNEASPSFVEMQRLAMRFRGLPSGSDPSKLDRFLHDARRSGLSSMQQSARTLARDLEAVRNAITEPWSSGQAEGQINRNALDRNLGHRFPSWCRTIGECPR